MLSSGPPLSRLERVASHISHQHGGVALVVGCGDGIGRAIIEHLAEDPGISTVVASRRNGSKLAGIVAELGSSKIHGIKADARVEEEVFKLFEVRSDLACDSRDNDSRSIRIEATASFRRTLYRDALVEDLILIFRSRVYFQETEKRYRKVWEMACLSAFYTGRECARRMGQRGKGTLVVTSATASVRGRAGYSAFSGALHAKRALAQSLTCELGPKGVHVAHVVIDGPVDTPWVRAQLVSKGGLPNLISPRTIAETVLFLHKQSSDGWSNEVDLRGASMSPWWS